MALHNGTFFLGLVSFWGHLGPFWAALAPFGPILASKGPFLAIFSSNVAANRRHPGVRGPNLVGRTALGRENFGLSLGPRAIGVPEISNEAHLLVACCLLLVACCLLLVACCLLLVAKINCPPLTPTPTKGCKPNC